MTQNDQATGISRRTVTKAMAWAVPAIAVVAAVPAHAASNEPPVIFDPEGISTTCKSTGAGKGCCPPNHYQFNLVFKNNGNVSYDVTIKAGEAEAVPNGCPTVYGPPADESITIAAGQAGTIVVCAGESDCNAQGTMTVNFTYTYEGAGGQPVEVPGSAHWDSVDPCGQNCP